MRLNIKNLRNWIELEKFPTLNEITKNICKENNNINNVVINAQKRLFTSSIARVSDKL